MNNFILDHHSLMSGLFFGPGLAFIVIWSLFWKGLALWHSAQRRQAWWFVILLVVNTLGILEIIYLLVVAKLKITKLFSSGLRKN